MRNFIAMTLIEGALIILFAGWWLVSLGGQFKGSAITSLRSKDLLHLIPNWRFFAPVPARKDYHLEVRWTSGQKRVSRWSRVDILPPRHPLRTMLWHPEKRVRKAFNTAVRRITRVLRESGRHRATRSLSYLLMLNFLEHRCDPDARTIQFRVVSCQDFAETPVVRLVFLSDWHLCTTGASP